MHGADVQQVLCQIRSRSQTLTTFVCCCCCRNAIYYSNRSAAAANISRFDEALSDAKMVLRLKPGWVKGHARAAAAYMGLQLYSEAKEEYEKAVKLEPDDKVICYWQLQHESSSAPHSWPAICATHTCNIVNNDDYKREVIGPPWHVVCHTITREQHVACEQARHCLKSAQYRA
jgi:stress-induced-phosphoprotein 1